MKILTTLATITIVVLASQAQAQTLWLFGPATTASSGMDGTWFDNAGDEFTVTNFPGSNFYTFKSIGLTFFGQLTNDEFTGSYNTGAPLNLNVACQLTFDGATQQLVGTVTAPGQPPVRVMLVRNRPTPLSRTVFGGKTWSDGPFAILDVIQVAGNESLATGTMNLLSIDYDVFGTVTETFGVSRLDAELRQAGAKVATLSLTYGNRFGAEQLSGTITWNSATPAPITLTP